MHWQPSVDLAGTSAADPGRVLTQTPVTELSPTAVAPLGVQPPLNPRVGVHVHRFQRIDDDLFSNCSLYGCRCGVVRPGM
jgi:hypothetical protein